MLRALAVRLPDGVAVADGKTTLTFAELEARTARIAAALASLGAYGHVVVLDMPVGTELFMAFLAVTRLGAIALPLHDLLRAEEIRFIVELTQPCLGIGTASRVFGVPVYRWEDLPSPAGRRVLCPEPLEETVAMLRTTSGTTGHPKLIRVPHGQLCRRLPVPAQQHARGARYGCALRHILPCYLILAALGAGGTIVFGPVTTAWQLERFISEERINHLWGIPALYEQVARMRPDVTSDLTCLRSAASSGAPLASETKSAVEARWRVPVLNSYGQSELGYLTDADETAPDGSVGFPAPGVEIRIVGSDGRELPSGVPGRIQARTDVPFGGYASGEPAPVDADGRFTTGDLGCLDEGGCLYLAGRETDSDKRGGIESQRP